eukprot:bmy_06973T0
MADGRWLQSRPDTVLAVTLVEGAGTGGEGRSCEKPFASGLLWGQQPADLGPGAAGSADYHGLCVKPAVCRWLEEAQEDAARAAEEPQLLRGAGMCTWFNVRMGFGFLPMTARAGVALGPPPPPVSVHQSKLHMEGFRSLKEGPHSCTVFSEQIGQVKTKS